MLNLHVQFKHLYRRTKYEYFSNEYQFGIHLISILLLLSHFQRKAAGFKKKILEVSQVTFSKKVFPTL